MPDIGQCPHDSMTSIGPFMFHGVTLCLDWCRICDSKIVRRVDRNAYDNWAIQIPESRPAARSLLLRGLAGMFEHIAQIFERKSEE